jgi:hypothetical protein
MQLNLPVIDRRITAGAHGAKEVNVHLAHVGVPSLGLVIYGPFCAVDLAAGGQHHLALIGRTLLRHYTLTYEGRTGTVILSNDAPPAYFDEAPPFQGTRKSNWLQEIRDEQGRRVIAAQSKT